jgi:hypothetical protein
MDDGRQVAYIRRHRKETAHGRRSTPAEDRQIRANALATGPVDDFELERIEAFRDPCIREGQRPTPEIIDTCADALRECLALLDARISGDRHAAA